MFQRYVTRSYKGFLCNARNVMGRTQLARMFPDICRHYARIADEVILEYATNPAQQLDHYAAKSGNFELFCDPEPALENAPLALEIDDDGFHRTFPGGTRNTRTARVNDPNVVVESVRTRGDALVVEGCLAFPGMDIDGPMDNPLEFVHQTAHAKIVVPLRQVARRDLWNTRNGRDLYAGWYAELGRAFTTRRTRQRGGRARRGRAADRAAQPRGRGDPSDRHHPRRDGGEGADRLRTHARQGLPFGRRTVVTDGTGRSVLTPGTSVLGAGRALLRGGETRINGAANGFAGDTSTERRPRTVRRRQGGRHTAPRRPGRPGPASAGATLREAAALLHDLGAVDALNLDGGCSSTMVVNGRLHNRPRDAEGAPVRERAVADALVVVEPLTGVRQPCREGSENGRVRHSTSTPTGEGVSER